jgi:ribose transport system substrate-binding protein
MFRSERARIGAGVVAVAMMAAAISACGSSSSSSSASSSATSSSAAATAPATSSTSTSSASSSGGSGNRMAIFYYNPSPYGIASLNGAKEEAAKLGVQLDAFDANNNPQLQSTQIQDAITTGKYKGFWVWGLNDVALTPIISKALTAGIKVASADYTWGPLSSQNVLTGNPHFVTTVGQSIGAESTNLEAAMNAACQKQVGSGHCNIAFLPGLANYPTDTVRINSMTAYYKGKPNYTFTVLPPGMYDQTASQKVAQTYLTANKNVNVFASFGDQMTAGAMTAMKLVGGYTPGKNIAVIGYGGAKELVALVKDGTVYATLGLYPASESRVGIAALNDALAGKPTPNVVNIINPATHPAIIDAAYLKSHPDFQPDWTLTGATG